MLNGEPTKSAEFGVMDRPGIGELVTIRDYLKTDEGLIYQSWMMGLYYGNTWYQNIEPNVFYARYRRILDYLVKKSHTRCAVLKEDPDVVIGYSVIEKDKLHWIFVKSDWRRYGLAKMLLSPDIKYVTHLTKLGKHLKPREWIFDPFEL
jgi:hypothetical protein